jgi:hypothetical protein
MNTALRVALLMRLLFGNTLTKVSTMAALILALPVVDPATRMVAQREWSASPISYAGFALDDMRARIHAWTAP